MGPAAALQSVMRRKELGMKVFVFLIILTLLLYFTKKKVRADAH